LKYLRNNELRQEIAYAVGGDPSRYDSNETVNLCKADLVRIAGVIADHQHPQQLTVRGLYDLIDDDVPGMDHTHNAGNSWGIARDDLKAIHESVGGQPPQIVVADGGRCLVDTGRCSSCGQTSDETSLGYSEAREDLVCSRCVTFLGEYGHYPDEDGPERSVTVEYEVSEL
jgi:hypothetical protein